MNLYSRLNVSLSEEGEYDFEGFAKEINEVINPPKPVAAGDIYVRAIYLVSDQINSYGGRFPEDELEGLCGLILDSPVLVGHKKNELPIARNFRAEVIQEENRNWVKVWFYWLKESEGSSELVANIDGGIYKEGSIGFVFGFPECGICGKDIRECGHAPLKSYLINGEEKSCHYNYRRIEKVLETSLVFRGANPDTYMTDKLIFENKYDDEKEAVQGNSNEDKNNKTKVVFSHHLKFENGKEYYASPLFFGLPVRCLIENGEVRIECEEKEIKPGWYSEYFNEFAKNRIDNICLRGRLFRMRGKQRLPLYKWSNGIGENDESGMYRLLVENVCRLDGRELDEGEVKKIKTVIKKSRNLFLKKYRKVEVWDDLQNGCVSRYGSEVISISQNVIQDKTDVRQPHYLLMEVAEIDRSGEGRLVYGVKFAEKDSRIVRTYETKIPAVKGETVLVKALRRNTDGRFAGYEVEDNLGRFYLADTKEEIENDVKKIFSYELKLVRDSGLLELKGDSLRRLLLFPQFNMYSLRGGKSLVGYDLEGLEKYCEEKLKPISGSVMEKGEFCLKSINEKNLVIECEGKKLQGRYRIHPAFWNEKKLVLLTRLNS